MVRVSRAEPDAAANLVLHVDAAALANPIEPSLVGRLEARVRTLRSKGHPAARHTLVRVDDAEPLFPVEDEMAVEFDWLDLCTPEQPCDIPIRLEAAFDPLLDDAQNRSPDDFIELEFEVEVRLDALDGRQLAGRRAQPRCPLTERAPTGERTVPEPAQRRDAASFLAHQR